ncbi:MAG: protein kinase [Bryobacteraceae bacterium]
MAGQIGRFSIVRELGQGGFGKVYLASDPQLADRYVAIKVMNTTQDASMRVRFRNEAVAAASLKHPNIVTILEYGEHQGQPYIAMEYLDGEDLGQRLKYGPPLTLFQKVTILEQTASALYAAHSHPSAIIHRDIKPANVMLLKDGSVKIMDFGIARLSGAESTRLTSTNVMIGSVLYMAPEQFTHGVTDVLTDIWSFGVLAYEILAENHPYQGGDVTQVMYRVTSVDPRPLLELVHGCPAELSAIVKRLMSRTREDRYQSLEDAGFDIRSIVTDLRHSEAGKMLQRAEDHYAAGRFEPAMQAVREALDIDSNLRSARVLREKLNKQIQGVAQRSRVEEHLQQSADCEARNDWDGALTQIQAAIRLDPSNTTLAVREETLQRARGNDRQLNQWMTLAQQALDADNLELAEQYVGAAEQLDAKARIAIHLRSKLDMALRRRREDAERARQVEAQRAAELEKQREAQLALEKAIAASEAVRTARSLLAGGKMDEALRGLLSSYDTLSDNPDFASMVEEAKRAIAARNAAAEVTRKVQTIRTIAARGDYARAKEACIVALRSHENDAQILELQQTIDRELQFRESVAEIQAELDGGRLTEGLWLAEQALRKFPENARLLSLVADIHDRRRRELLRKLISDAHMHAGNQNWTAASEILRDAQALDASDAELISTVVEFQCRSREDLEQRIAQVRAMLNRGESSQAGQAVEAIRERFPDSPEIAALAAEVNAALSQRIRSLSGMHTPIHFPEAKKSAGPSRPKWLLAVIPGVALAAAVGWFTLRPKAVPVLSVKPDKIDFVYQKGGLTPPPMRIAVRVANGTGAGLSARSPEWLSVEQSAAEGGAVLDVKLKPEALAPGEHSGELLIEGEGARPVAIPAHLRVDRAPAGALVVEPREVSLTRESSSATISVTSESDRQNIQIVGVAAWLLVEPVTGRTPMTLQVRIRPGQTKPGVQSCTLTILPGNDASKAKTVNVVFTIPEVVKPVEPPKPVIEKPKEEKPKEEKPKEEEKKPVEPEKEKPKVRGTQKDWNGAFSGRLVWRGMLAPGASIDLTHESLADNVNKFPWLFDTHVAVTADAPAVVEVHPSRANTWNLIRIRNTGTQPIPLVTLNWRINP